VDSQSYCFDLGTEGGFKEVTLMFFASPMTLQRESKIHKWEVFVGPMMEAKAQME
jgi:hypothetical protein